MAFAGAPPIHFGSIDADQPDFGTAIPEGISVDDTGVAFFVGAALMPGNLLREGGEQGAENS